MAFCNIFCKCLTSFSYTFLALECEAFERTKTVSFRPVMLNGCSHCGGLITVLCLSAVHNFFSLSRSLTIEVSTKKPLLALVCDVAAIALRPDVVLVPAGGHVPPACKMSCLSDPDQILPLAGKAFDVAVVTCVLGTDVPAEPMIELIAQFG
jgi:hypothetical protein